MRARRRAMAVFVVGRVADGVVLLMAAAASRTSSGRGAGWVGRGQLPADPALQRTRGVVVLPAAGGVAWPTGSQS